MTDPDDDQTVALTVPTARTAVERAAEVERVRRMHLLLHHEGDAAACRCELVDVDSGEDVLIAELLEDVGGQPAGVAARRYPMTGAHWRRPKL